MRNRLLAAVATIAFVIGLVAAPASASSGYHFDSCVSGHQMVAYVDYATYTGPNGQARVKAYPSVSVSDLNSNSSHIDFDYQIVSDYGVAWASGMVNNYPSSGWSTTNLPGANGLVSAHTHAHVQMGVNGDGIAMCTVNIAIP